jgi:hypothetical protein
MIYNFELRFHIGLRHADGPEEGILIDIKRAHGVARRQRASERREEKAVDGMISGSTSTSFPAPTLRLRDRQIKRNSTHDIPLHDERSFSIRLEVTSSAHICIPIVAPRTRFFAARSPRSLNLFLFTFVLMDNLRSRLVPKTILAHRRDRVSSRAEGIVVARSPCVHMD